MKLILGGLLAFSSLTFAQMAPPANAPTPKLKSTTRTVDLDGEQFFIDQGLVFRVKAGDITGHSIEGSSDVRALLSAHGRLLAQDTDGKLYMLAKTPVSKKDVWIHILGKTKNIFTDERRLFAVMKDGKLMIHDGQLNIRYYLFDDGGIRSGTADNVFYDSTLGAVTHLAEQDGQIRIVFKNHTSENVDDLK